MVGCRSGLTAQFAKLLMSSVQIRSRPPYKKKGYFGILFFCMDAEIKDFNQSPRLRNRMFRMVAKAGAEGPYRRHTLHLIPETWFTLFPCQMDPLLVPLFYSYRQSILNHNLKN